jgi:uronate dehydrogenase
VKKIAVTGAAGVVGRALREDLAKDHDVVAIDIKDVPTVVDVRDLAALEVALAGCDAVVHLAASSSVSSTWEQVYATNIAGDYNLFEAARRTNVRHVIYASSNHVVGMLEGDGEMIGVNEPFCADSLYGAGKAFGEVLGRHYSEQHGLYVACIRIGSILAGDTPETPRHVATWMSKRDFARLVRAILARDVPFGVVYGVGDNVGRFWDLEPGRALYGFWPLDGTNATLSSPTS